MKGQGYARACSTRTIRPAPSGPTQPIAPRRTKGSWRRQALQAMPTGKSRRERPCQKRPPRRTTGNPKSAQRSSISLPSRNIAWPVHPYHRYRAGQDEDRPRQHRLQHQKAHVPRKNAGRLGAKPTTVSKGTRRHSQITPSGQNSRPKMPHDAIRAGK